MPMKILLLSGSKTYDQPEFLEHAMSWIKAHFGSKKKILFVPYALKNHEEYAAIIAKAFAKADIEVISAHTRENPVTLLDQVDGIYIGGGNTFRLLQKLYETNLIVPIAKKVRAGMPYMGASAGTNMACPGIYTTNDMPIILPHSLQAIHLINFQINPHYLDPEPNSTHMGETREKRISEFHEVLATPVLGLREGSALSITNNHTILLGTKTARLFRPGMAPIEIKPGTDLAQWYDLTINVNSTNKLQFQFFESNCMQLDDKCMQLEEKYTPSDLAMPSKKITSKL